MDNFREWLSDNLRYFMLGGVILIIVAVLFFSIRACTGSGKGTSDGEQTTAQDNSQGNDPSSPEDDGETNDGKKEEDTNPLEDGSEEVTALMNSYYKALGEKDITTLRTLVNNLTPSDESRITNAKDYIEGYQVSKVYMKKGMDDNSYVVYTKGSFICKGIDTPAPSLWSAYVVKDSDGTYRILGDLEQNTTVSTYMDSLISDEDVKDLQVNYGIWKSERIKDKKHLQAFQKRILDFIQIVGAVFLAITILLRVQLDMRVPVWCTIICFIIVAGAFLCSFIVSKRLREM